MPQMQDISKYQARFYLGSVAGFEDEYMEYINKAKAKAGVLIYMFDDMLMTMFQRKGL
jgi:hypothetical protein